MGSLDGKVAVVTGGASGMGLAIAGAYVEEGAIMYLLDLGDRVSERATELGPLALPIRADISVADDVRAAVAQVVAEQGRIDVWVNNAGIHGKITPVGALSESDFDELVAVNFKGVFLGMREVLPIMGEAGGGSMINTSSIASSRGYAPMTTVYAATKAAVIALTQGAALEYGPAGVRVNAICPGVIRTPMGDPSLADAISAITPLRRVGEASDIARLAVFLAGDDSSFITGESIVVDGGFTLKFPLSRSDEDWKQPWIAERYES
jgi:NAD(P)-dependent dehydrogenase (short-subunit alcohol dehydrogenase family)